MRALGAWGLAVAILLGACGCGLLREHEGPSAYVGDSAISARVEIALVHGVGIEAREIDVDTYQGTVTLDGVVDTAAIARSVEQITRGIEGVRAVESRLQVAVSGRPSGDPP